MAERLHMSVAQLNECMSPGERRYWAVYLARKGQIQELETLKAKARKGK